MRKAPLTLWRMLLGDLLRLLGICAFVLIAIGTFAMAVRPLAAGQVGPLGAMQLMALAITPTLQFTLPFAAGFAATMAYHRFASDNESIASAAGGVSYRSMLAPAAAVALILSIGIGVMAHSVIPRFFQLIEMLIRQDAARLIVNAVERGESVEVHDMLLYADEVMQLGSDLENGVYDRLVLEGAVGVNLDSAGRVSTDLTAEHLEAWIQAATVDGEDGAVATLRARKAYLKRRGVQMVRLDAAETKPLPLPRIVADKPKFLSTETLLEIREDPYRHSDVARMR
ncbi:MAG: LptF/LptG family permease, partial [Planctomycetota bacterium]|nr:LptF/LptG family permease [Planctomycetota bacterium]